MKYRQASAVCIYTHTMHNNSSTAPRKPIGQRLRHFFISHRNLDKKSEIWIAPIPISARERGKVSASLDEPWYSLDIGFELPCCTVPAMQLRRPCCLPWESAGTVVQAVVRECVCVSFWFWCPHTHTHTARGPNHYWTRVSLSLSLLEATEDACWGHTLSSYDRILSWSLSQERERERKVEWVSEMGAIVYRLLLVIGQGYRSIYENIS